MLRAPQPRLPCSDGRDLTEPAAIEIRVLEETGSTNADMLQLAQSGLGEGVWLRAVRQTGGRGRLGRAWEGQEGNLFASSIVRLRSGDPLAPSLALVAGIAAHDALTQAVGAMAIRLKWPNDIIAGRAKLCGILLERTSDAVVVGIGANVAAAPQLADRETTSLQALGCPDWTAEKLMAVLAERFAYWLDRWRLEGLSAITHEWLERAHPSGTPLRAALPDGRVEEGRFETLDAQGNLVLRLRNGQMSVIHAGDIFLA